MVSRISMSQFQALPDMLSNDNWVFMLSGIPGYNGSVFNDVCLKALSATIPGVSQEAFQVTIAGFVRFFRGRKLYSHTLSIALSETVDFSATNAMRSWNEYIAGTNSGTSKGYSNDYTVTGTIYTFDTTGKAVDVANFRKLQLTDLGDTSLNGESTQAMTLNPTFRFDYAEFNSISIR